MNVLVLMGSPRLHGNTAELCKPMMEEMKALGAQADGLRRRERETTAAR